MFPNWGVGQTASKEIREAEEELELQVSEILGKMSLLWISIGDESGPSSDRAYLEKNVIGLLAGAGTGPVDLPTGIWLGRWSTRPSIRESGLWNVNYVGAWYDRFALDVLERYVDITLGLLPTSNLSFAPANWQARESSTSNLAQQMPLLGES